MEATIVESFESQRVRDIYELVEPSSIYRQVTVRPAMSGHNSLFIGQVGDWTWEAVADLCGTDVFSARNASGSPTYLAFYYIHIRSSPTIHVAGLTFGDRLDVVSTLFDFGSESILTLHRIKRAVDAHMPPVPIDLEEFYDAPRSDCLYVETFNRWIARSRATSNQDLVKSSPVDFRHAHLSPLPDRYSPRLICGLARTNNTFHDMQSPEYESIVDEFKTTYRIDITRDINGVGLVYFASYFSIIDGAVRELWTDLGGSSDSFLKRIVLDHKVCYFANADIDSILIITIALWRKTADPRHVVYNTKIEDQQTGRIVAVSTMHLLS